MNYWILIKKSKNNGDIFNTFCYFNEINVGIMNYCRLGCVLLL